MNNKNLGIIAGNGILPVKVSYKAHQEGYNIFSVCFDSANHKEIKKYSQKSVFLSPGETQKILTFLHDNLVDKVIFIGKVPKSIYFTRPRIDSRGMEVLKKLKRLNDDSIMLTAIDELEKENIKVLEQTIFIKEYFAKKGMISKSVPTVSQNMDIEYGFEIAKLMGKHDIGQTVVVQDKMILAVEAIEGTDEAIKRGCKLGDGNAIVVKVSKPSQDQRFDIPVVGTKTLKTMNKYGGKLLAIEANETLIVDEEEFLSHANKYGITVIAI